MADINRYIGVDLGAESGRVMLGEINGEDLCLEEIHRFENRPIDRDGSLNWDFSELLSQIKVGIAKSIRQADGRICGIGVDSWGVDFGLLGEDGELLENPFHYRDRRTNGVPEKAFEIAGKRTIYDNTGLQFLQFNSVYQLLAMKLAGSAVLEKARRLIFMADLVSYYLCGRAYGEYTLASTSQLMDMKTGRWSEELFEKLGLPVEIMPEIVQPGTVVGKLRKEIADVPGSGEIDIIAIGSHDTASAVAAVPALGERWAYLSSGTWSLMGLEVPQAIINDKTFEYSFTNEGGVDNTIRLLKNIMGLWLSQECRRQWQREGAELSYADLTEMAEKAEPFFCRIDPDYGDFLAPGDMPQKINNYLAGRGVGPIEEKGQMIRVILESLAFKYRLTLERLEDVAGMSIDNLHLVGGGIQNELLCQFTADATGKRVVAGPVEATAIGNILMQARAVGQIETLAQARRIVANSFELKEYTPQNNEVWNQQYKKIDFLE
jgi:rhamnulokinase